MSSIAGGASYALFTRPELEAMIKAAHSVGVKVAAHTTRVESIRTLIELDIDSIEHGFGMDKDALFLLRAKNRTRPVTWNPTLAVYWTQDPTGAFLEIKKSVQDAIEMGGIPIACGGDTGTFAHGHNSLEMELLVGCGAKWQDVLRWATLEGWKCVRGLQWEGKEGVARLHALEETVKDQTRLGAMLPLGDNDVPCGLIREAFAADIIATRGDFSSDFASAISAENIVFVMKGGVVVKQDGQAKV